mmetsp:Transcript_6358/g.20017  ORF Transcript_6358/g.20017 Transcript_6358/m.20017 type:complete len:259 (-) Transcript_6358:770-1546(-)
MPGKTYMLLHCDGTRVLPLYSTGANGDPVATMARPSVQWYACSAVHSALDVGFDIGMMIGRGAYLPNLVMTLSVKMPPTPVRPSRQFGSCIAKTSSSGVPSGTVSLCHWSQSSLPACGLPCLPSALPMAPRLVTMTMRRFASSCVRPARTMASITDADTPCPAEPPPQHTTRKSEMGVSAMRAAERSAPTVTAPVPCMSSLKQRNLLRYLASRGTALGVSKSSNWMVASGHRATTAVMNSSTMSKYSFPCRRLWRMPM